MIYSQCSEPEPGEVLETNGLYNSMRKLSHYIFAATGPGPIVPHCFHTGPVSSPGLGVNTLEVLQAESNTPHCHKPRIIYHMKQEKPKKSIHLCVT